MVMSTRSTIVRAVVSLRPAQRCLDYSAPPLQHVLAYTNVQVSFLLSVVPSSGYFFLFFFLFFIFDMCVMTGVL